MKNSFVFISNAFGGIKTFQDTLIKFITKTKIECFLIDDQLFKNYKKYKVKYHKVNVLKQIYETFKLLNKIKQKNNKKNTIFVFSNPIIFVIYFMYIKLTYKKKKNIFFCTQSFN